MTEIINNILDSLQWIYSEVLDHIGCKHDLLELQEDLRQVCLMLEYLSHKFDFNEADDKQLHHTLVQLYKTVESASNIHNKVINKSEKYEMKPRFVKMCFLNRKKVKVYKDKIKECRHNVHFNTNCLIAALQLKTFEDPKMRIQDSFFNSTIISVSFYPPEVILDFIKFKRDEIGNWTCLGSGGFGDVYDATFGDTHRPVAVKKIQIRQERKKKRLGQMFQNEVDILRRLHHPNVVRLIAAISQDNREQSLYMIVMEKLYKTIGDISQELSEQEKLKVALGMANGLGYIHSCNVAHRDIKPENIMLSKDGTPKFIDFGLSKDLCQQQQQAVQQCSSPGTPLWMSPERRKVTSSAYCYYASDVYSLGLVIAYLLTGRDPNHSYSAIQIYQDGLQELAYDDDESICGLILECLDDIPSKRHSAEDLYFRLKMGIQKVSFRAMDGWSQGTTTRTVDDDSVNPSVISRIQQTKSSVNNLDQILLTLQENPYSDVVHVECAIALADITLQYPESRVRLYEMDGIRMILSSLETFCDSKLIVLHDLCTLSNVMKGYPKHKRKIYKQNGIEIILSSLERFREDEGVQRIGLCALGNIMSGMPEHKMKVYEMNGIEVILSSLERFNHCDNATVIIHGLAALTNIMYGFQNHKVQVYERNGIEIILTCLETCHEAAEVLDYGYLALASISYCHHSAHVEKIVTLNGISIIQQGMKLFPNNETIQQSGNQALEVIQYFSSSKEDDIFSRQNKT